ncbi:MAG: hypothetical protein WCQ49_00430 [Candidatus Saccharibacteria bacterium]
MSIILRFFEKIIKSLKKDEKTRVIENFDYHLNEYVDDISRLMRGISYITVKDTAKEYFLDLIEGGLPYEESTNKALDHVSQILEKDYKFGIQNIASKHKCGAIKGLCKITKVPIAKEEKQHIIL